MSGLATALAMLVWLTGLVVLLRFPIVSIGTGVALVAWTWDPDLVWLVLGVTCVVSWARLTFGPSERYLARYPELAVVLVAGVVAALAGGQVAAGSLAVLVLALGWFVRTTVVVGLAGPAEVVVPVPPAAPPAPLAPRAPTLVVAPPPPEGLRIDAGECPRCGGLLVATEPTSPSAGGPVLVAEANCMGCGRHLVGVGDPAMPDGPVTWIDPDGWREGIA